VDAGEEEVRRLRELGEAMGASAVQRCLEVLGQAVSDMARAPDARLVLEVAVVRLARRELGTPVEVLAERVERLERALAALTAGAPLPAAPAAPPSAVPAPAPAGGTEPVDGNAGDDPAPGAAPPVGGGRPAASPRASLP